MPCLTRTIAIVASFLLLNAVPVGIASGEPSRPVADSPTQSEREAGQRERAKAIIEARLERLRAEEASLRATLAAIEAGQPLSELRLPGPPRERRSEEREPQRDGDGPDRADRSDEDFSDEQIRAFIAEVYPEWVERIDQLATQDPEALRRLLRERRPRLIELMIERRDHPAIFEARQRMARSEMMVRRAAWSVVRAEADAERAEAEARLTALLGEQFDSRLALMEAELSEIDAEADEKRREIAEARDARETLIAERKADLIRAIRDRRPDPRRSDRPNRPERPDVPGRDGPPGR
jgi:hypothetical protein